MATFGYTTIGGSTYAAGSNNSTNPPGLLITLDQVYDLEKITAHVKNTVSSSSQTCKLYAGSAGALGSLLATTNTASVTTTFAWVDFTFATPYNAASNTYWIEFFPDGNNGPGGNASQIHYDAGGGADTAYRKTDFGIPSYNTDQFSIYATGTVVTSGRTEAGSRTAAGARTEAGSRTGSGSRTLVG